MELRTGLTAAGVVVAVAGASFVGGITCANQNSARKAECIVSVNTALGEDGFTLTDVDADQNLCLDKGIKTLRFNNLKMGACALDGVYIDAEIIPGKDGQTKGIKGYSMVLGHNAIKKNVAGPDFPNAAQLREKVPSLSGC